MKERQSGRGPSGFTLIELLAVLALMLILMLIAAPALRTSIRHSKLRGIANETTTLMRLARLEAIKRSCTSIVQIVESPPKMEGFADCDLNGIADADKPPLGTFPLAPGVELLAPPNLQGKNSVVGFSLNPIPGKANAAIFRPDGSIQDTGGFHFADARGNFLEVWVAPAATARIEIHKCRVCTDANDRSDWYASGDGGQPWTWN